MRGETRSSKRRKPHFVAEEAEVYCSGIDGRRQISTDKPRLRTERLPIIFFDVLNLTSYLSTEPNLVPRQHQGDVHVLQQDDRQAHAARTEAKRAARG